LVMEKWINRDKNDPNIIVENSGKIKFEFEIETNPLEDLGDSGDDFFGCRMKFKKCSPESPDFYLL